MCRAAYLFRILSIVVTSFYKQKPRSGDVTCLGHGPGAGKGQSWDSKPSLGLSPVPFVLLQAASFPGGRAG